MKDTIKKYYKKALIFTICPFIIPLIFTIPSNIINKLAQFIIALILIAIDIYYVFKYSREEAVKLHNLENDIFDNKKYRISQRILNRISNCEKIKGGFIQEETYEVHHKLNENILLYNPHRYLERVCEEIKSLIAEITRIDLEYISVSFIYKYPEENEEGQELCGWKWITGKDPTMNIDLIELINKKESYYYYLMQNDIAASFENDKSKLMPKHYWPEERDTRHNIYGSISAHKMSFRNNNSTFCTGYLTISTYGKQFYSKLDRNNIFDSENELEQVLFDYVIPPFRKIIETELGFLYLRHKYRQENKK